MVKYMEIYPNSGAGGAFRPPAPPLKWAPRVLGHGRALKNNFWKSDFLMIFRSVSRPHQGVYSCPIRSGIWLLVILEKCWKIKFLDPPKTSWKHYKNMSFLKKMYRRYIEIMYKNVIEKYVIRYDIKIWYLNMIS